MKYLTISKIKDAYSAIPHKEKSRIAMERAEFILEYKKKMGNKCDCYYDPAMNRIITIEDYDSLDEYYKSLTFVVESMGYSDYQSVPLIKADLKKLETYVNQLKADV
jgi:hypothetical protein